MFTCTGWSPESLRLRVFAWLLCLSVLTVRPALAQTIPQLPQGSTQTITASQGSQGPSIWSISLNGQVIANSNTPNG